MEVKTADPDELIESMLAGPHRPTTLERLSGTRVHERDVPRALRDCVPVSTGKEASTGKRLRRWLGHETAMQRVFEGVDTAPDPIGRLVLGHEDDPTANWTLEPCLDLRRRKQTWKLFLEHQRHPTSTGRPV